MTKCIWKLALILCFNRQTTVIIFYRRSYGVGWDGIRKCPSPSLRLVILQDSFSSCMINGYNNHCLVVYFCVCVWLCITTQTFIFPIYFIMTWLYIYYELLYFKIGFLDLIQHVEPEFNSICTVQNLPSFCIEKVYKISSKGSPARLLKFECWL